jgi:hypothetical protein
VIYLYMEWLSEWLLSFGRKRSGTGTAAEAGSKGEEIEREELRPAAE